MSKKYCTINTHSGLYQFNHLPFGIASAPAQFQKIMDTILQGIPGAMCYIDDIVVTGATEGKHLQNLEEVFSPSAGLWHQDEKEKVLHARLGCLPRSFGGY